MLATALAPEIGYDAAAALAKAALKSGRTIRELADGAGHRAGPARRAARPGVDDRAGPGRRARRGLTGRTRSGRRQDVTISVPSMFGCTVQVNW